MGSATKISDAMGLVRTRGDVAIVHRGRPRSLIIMCPCGCGERYPINLDSRAGPAWRLYRDLETGLSLFPSVWRESGCRAHYILWRDTAFLFGAQVNSNEGLPWERWRLPDGGVIASHVPKRGTIYFLDVADQLDLVPWDVLQVCRNLTSERVLFEDTTGDGGRFGHV